MVTVWYPFSLRYFKSLSNKSGEITYSPCILGSFSNPWYITIGSDTLSWGFESACTGDIGLNRRMTVAIPATNKPPIKPAKLFLILKLKNMRFPPPPSFIYILALYGIWNLVFIRKIFLIFLTLLLNKGGVFGFCRNIQSAFWPCSARNSTSIENENWRQERPVAIFPWPVLQFRIICRSWKKQGDIRKQIQELYLLRN